VDKAAPTVSSITRASATPTNAASVSWTVTFSESVTGVGAADFSLAASGLGGSPAITVVAGSGTTYTVTAGTGTGSGTLGLNLVDADSITDGSGNYHGATGTAGAALSLHDALPISVDKAAPTVSSITRASATPTNGSSVSWTVTFSESVTGV